MNNIEKIELLEHIAIAYKDDETINNELVSPQGKFIKNKELAEAIENLIKENKELKEKREEYEKQLDLDYVKENYIPKSKIEKALDKMNERYMTPEAISNSNGATFNYWTGKRDMCIELLEKGE